MFSTDALRRVRGIRPVLAVIDARSGRVYVNRVVAEPGATLQGLLGFTPSSVQIALLDPRGAAVYSQTLSTAQSLSWVVPPTIPRRTILVIAPGRPGFPLDSATYLARLQLTS